MSNAPTGLGSLSSYGENALKRLNFVRFALWSWINFIFPHLLIVGFGLWRNNGGALRHRWSWSNCIWYITESSEMTFQICMTFADWDLSMKLKSADPWFIWYHHSLLFLLGWWAELVPWKWVRVMRNWYCFFAFWLVSLDWPFFFCLMRGSFFNPRWNPTNVSYKEFITSFNKM